MQFGKLKLDRCRYGWMLHQGAYIGKCFELYGQYSEAEVEIMRAFLRPGDTAIDVGANIGDLTLPMSQFVGNSGRVYAIESHSSTFQILNANLALNGVTNVKTLNNFIASSADVDTSGVWGKHGFVSQKWGASFMTLDSLALDACRFIKVDVDGKEYEVLKSGENTISAHRPIIYFENDDRDKSPQLLKYVMDLGYSMYFHAAPIFSADNFFGNTENHWAPQIIISQMILAIPDAMVKDIGLKLPKITDPNQWWAFA